MINTNSGFSLHNAFVAPNDHIKYLSSMRINIILSIWTQSTCLQLLEHLASWLWYCSTRELNVRTERYGHEKQMVRHELLAWKSSSLSIQTLNTDLSIYIVRARMKKGTFKASKGVRIWQNIQAKAIWRNTKLWFKEC